MRGEAGTRGTRDEERRRRLPQPEGKDGQNMKRDKAAAARAAANGKQQKKRGPKPAGREKGSGSLERHGKNWRAVWTVDGVTFRRSTGTDDRTEAERRLADFIAPFYLKKKAKKDKAAAKKARREGGTVFAAAADALEKDAERDRRAAGRMLVPLSGMWEAFNGSLRRRSCSRECNLRYEQRVRIFTEWMQRNRPTARGLADVDKETAEAFMREIRARSAPKTFNDYRALLSQVWKVLDADAGLDGFNPWREIVPLDRETHTRRELTAEELARTVGALNGEWRTLFALGIYTGLRLGDCLALTWGAVDLDRGFVQVIPHKTEKHGTVVRIPLFPVLARILAEKPPRSRHGKILPGLEKEYTACPSVFSRRIKAVFEAAGIETQGETERRNPKTKTARKAVEVGFHSLRHTFVSLCANAGVPLHIVQAIVGHTNTAMTAHYFHVSDDALRGAVASLPDVFTRGRAAALPAPAEAVGGDSVAAVLAALREVAGKLAAAKPTAREWKEAAAILADAKRRA